MLLWRLGTSRSGEGSEALFDAFACLPACHARRSRQDWIAACLPTPSRRFSLQKWCDPRRGCWYRARSRAADAVLHTCEAQAASASAPPALPPLLCYPSPLPPALTCPSPRSPSSPLPRPLWRHRVPSQQRHCQPCCRRLWLPTDAKLCTPSHWLVAAAKGAAAGAAAVFAAAAAVQALHAVRRAGTAAGGLQCMPGAPADVGTLRWPPAPVPSVADGRAQQSALDCADGRASAAADA